MVYIFVPLIKTEHGWVKNTPPPHGHYHLVRYEDGETENVATFDRHTVPEQLAFEAAKVLAEGSKVIIDPNYFLDRPDNFRI